MPVPPKVASESATQIPHGLERSDGCQRPCVRIPAKVNAVPIDLEHRPCLGEQGRARGGSVPRERALAGKQFAMLTRRIAMNLIEEALWMRPEYGCSQRELASACGLFGGGGEPAAAPHGGGRRGGPLPGGRGCGGVARAAVWTAYRAAQDFTAMHKQLSARKSPTLQPVVGVPRSAPRGVWVHKD